MNALFDNAVVEVLTLVLVGVLVWAVLRGVGWALRVLPVSRARADLTERLWPAVVGLGVVLYALFAMRLLLGNAPGFAPLAGAVVLGVFVALSWYVLRDTVSGVFLRAGRACRVGDYVHIGDVEGRVESMGWRAMVVVTATDKEAIIPYSRAVQSSIVRTPQRAQASPHRFTVELGDRPVGEVKERVRRAALLCHWSSVVREPELSVEGEDALAVTVYALDAERAYEIEAAVRRALKEPPPKRAKPAPRFTASKRPSYPPRKPGPPAE